MDDRAFRDAQFSDFSLGNEDLASFGNFNAMNIFNVFMPADTGDDDMSWTNELYNETSYGSMSTAETSYLALKREVVPECEQIFDNIEVKVDVQPPVEVRTRTPSENRTFSTQVSVFGDLKRAGVKALRVRLIYATGEEVAQRILGGTKQVDLSRNPKASTTQVRYTNLSLSEASTKHKEKEFQLHFILVTQDGREIPTTTHTTPFYAYSNTKVLTRRRNVDVRCLSREKAPADGGHQMHIVGRPFIEGPSFGISFETPLGVFNATNVEIYSESVVFFTTPPIPRGPEPDVPCRVRVTNDGRNYSEPLDFLFQRV